jgi:hypothetical protein
MYVAYRMLYWVSEMNFISESCLTAAEQIIKYCLKFLARNFRYTAERLLAAAWLTKVPFLPPRMRYIASRHSDEFNPYPANVDNMVSA